MGDEEVPEGLKSLAVDVAAMGEGMKGMEGNAGRERFRRPAFRGVGLDEGAGVRDTDVLAEGGEPFGQELPAGGGAARWLVKRQLV